MGVALVDCFDYGVRRLDASGLIEMSVPAGSLEVEVGDENYQGNVRLRVGEGATASADVRLTEPVEKR